MTEWQERLNQEAKEVVEHGQGQMVLNVGPIGKDQVNILITAGKTYRFIISRPAVSLKKDI